MFSEQGAFVMECYAPFEQMQQISGSTVKLPAVVAKKPLYSAKMVRREYNHAFAILSRLTAFISR